MRKPLRHKLVQNALICACFALILSGCGHTSADSKQKGGGGGGKGGRGGGAQMIIPVAVAKADVRDLPIVLNGLGSVDAFNTVAVKSRIDGQLIKVNVKEGQEVKQGELLAEIDPRPYEVQLSQAQATLFKDQAALKDARLNLERFQQLSKDGVISKQQFDTQGSLEAQLDGAVRADQAQIDTVKLNLTYTRITAPVSGRIGLRQVDVGNMVHASDPNGLLVITQLQPIAVIFSLPQDNLQAVSQHMSKGKLAVDAYSRDDQTKIATGFLTTIDNQIDVTTGTGKLKAVFENRDRSLWPNEFVNIHLLLEVKKNNTVVPSAAIQRGPQGTYVFVVKPDNTAEMRNVAISISQANLTAVSQGLKPGELVVTDGQDKLQPGTKVAVREPGAEGQNSGQSGGGRNGGGQNGGRNGGRNGGQNGGQASDSQTQ